MNKDLIALLERARTWPAAAQDELLQLAQEIEEELKAGVYSPIEDGLPGDLPGDDEA